LAKVTEEERRAMQDSDAFFDLDGGHGQNGRRESPGQHAALASLTHDINDKLQLQGESL
jgi:hypothetical protein